MTVPSYVVHVAMVSLADLEVGAPRHEPCIYV